MKKIYLHYYNASHRGPGMVVQNLIKGIKQLDDVELVRKPNSADMVGCLQAPHGYDAQWMPQNALMGPNLFVIPEEMPELVKKYQRFVVPSQWVKDFYERSPLMHGKQIDVWSVGIDTEYWGEHELRAYAQEFDCFVYFKNRTREELGIVTRALDELDMIYRVIEYGSYTEKQLLELCHGSKFAILLTGTESQGIAYMNILSTNTPCLVFNKSDWEYEQNRFIKCPATSVPYFSPECGIMVATLDFAKDDIELFSRQLSKYGPRNYILLNHDLKLSAQNYRKIF